MTTQITTSDPCWRTCTKCGTDVAMPWPALTPAALSPFLCDDCQPLPSRARTFAAVPCSGCGDEVTTALPAPRLVLCHECDLDMYEASESLERLHDLAHQSSDEHEDPWRILMESVE